MSRPHKFFSVMPSKMEHPFRQRRPHHEQRLRFAGKTWCVALFLGALAWGPAVHAQDWAKAMLNETAHDFGVVARGAKVEHRFIIENVYEEDASIKSVASSCGCSSPQVNRKLLKTWEKAELLVTLDTRGFLGRKDATITIEFDKPFSAEVQLHIHAYIRSDIVVQPGAVLFNSVSQGEGAKQDVLISYAGRDDWRLAKLECANPAIAATAIETRRAAGQVVYSMSVTLKPNAPPGYFRDQLVLVTNDYDVRAARVPVTVEGLVMAALSVQPSSLLMGVVQPGRAVTHNLVIQGRTPFRIVAVQPSDERFQCKASKESKAVHVLPVTFLATDAKTSAGTINAKLRVETDLTGANTVDVGVSVQVTPAATTKP
jgi:hypothetical protein